MVFIHFFKFEVNLNRKSTKDHQNFNFNCQNQLLLSCQVKIQMKKKSFNTKKARRSIKINQNIIRQNEINQNFSKLNLTMTKSSLNHMTLSVNLQLVSYKPKFVVNREKTTTKWEREREKKVNLIFKNTLGIFSAKMKSKIKKKNVVVFIYSTIFGESSAWKRKYLSTHTHSSFPPLFVKIDLINI